MKAETAGSPEANAALVRASFAAFNAGDTETLLSVMAPDFSMHLAEFPAPHPLLSKRNEDRMGEVLGNLLENALRHTPTGGTVTVAATSENGAVELAVSDTGEGIEGEHLGRVFERFYRVERARASRGSGIGLAIAKAIVEAHRGTISAESVGASRGATFRIRLPAA